MNAPSKFVLLGNGMVALTFLRASIERGQPPANVVLNKRKRQRNADEIRQAAANNGIPVTEWSVLERDRLLTWLRAERDAWLLSVYFAHIIDDEILKAVDGRAVNLHASLLPWCRGAHTNVWPLIEHVPAGVTLHTMVPALDAGNILSQREVPVHPWDTAYTLYRRLESAALDLLLRDWPEGVIAAWPGQPASGEGSMHRVRDLQDLNSFDLETHAEARRLFDLLRARTFPPYPGLRLTLDGKCVEARVELRECAE